MLISQYGMKSSFDLKRKDIVESSFNILQLVNILYTLKLIYRDGNRIIGEKYIFEKRCLAGMRKIFMSFYNQKISYKCNLSVMIKSSLGNTCTFVMMTMDITYHYRVFIEKS